MAHRTLLVLLLTLLLLGGQFALLTHELDVAVHAEDEGACEICLHAAGLHTPVAAAPASAPVPCPDAQPPYAERHALSLTRALPWEARAPPLNS